MGESFLKSIAYIVTIGAVMALSSAAYAVNPDEAKKIAIEFIGHKNVSLVQGGFESWGNTEGKGKKCYHFVSPDDNQGLSIDVDTTTGGV